MKTQTEWRLWLGILTTVLALCVTSAIYWTWFGEGEWFLTIISWICIPATGGALWYELMWPAREAERRSRDREMWLATLRELGIDPKDIYGED